VADNLKDSAKHAKRGERFEKQDKPGDKAA